MCILYSGKLKKLYRSIKTIKYCDEISVCVCMENSQSSLKTKEIFYLHQWRIHQGKNDISRLSPYPKTPPNPVSAFFFQQKVSIMKFIINCTL